MNKENQNNQQQNSQDCKIVRFDWAIKNILRNKANFDILEGFLSELLKQKIVIDSLLESESNQETRDDKFNRVDILVKTEHGEKILIEVQAATEWDYYHRMLFGTSKLVTEYIDKGQPYNIISKVISVSILFFDLGVGRDYVYKGITEFKGVHVGDILQFSQSSRELYLNKLQSTHNSPSDIFPIYYVIQLKKFSNIIKDKFDQWVYLLKNESIKPEFDALGVQSAKQKLDILKLSPEERRRYDIDMDWKSFEASLADSHDADVRVARKAGMAEGLEKGMAEGLEKGLAEGILTEKVARVKRLKDRGFSIEDIADIMDLSSSEVEQLQYKIST